ncbi:MAG: hypothetical protein HY701_14300 [Gemmatimonadetes bacterium]|nr:hypothetical protein [Gemmatimonadota bacterium]
MRKLRKFFDVGLPIIGMVMVFAGALLFSGMAIRMIVVLVGVLMLEAGVWQLAAPLLPNERKYLSLRNEADRFIGLVRQLNAAGVAVREERSPAAESEFARVRQEMLRSIDRMSEVAGMPESVADVGAGGSPGRRPAS